MSYNYVTVTGQYGNPDPTTGLVDAVTGSVEFYVDAPVVDVTNKVTLTVAVDNQALDSNGAFSVKLIAMDNAGISPFNWWFIPRIAGVPSAPQQLSVLFANGATQDITSL